MLPLTPGALSSLRLEERPAPLPPLPSGPNYSDQRRCRFEVLVFEPSGPRRQSLHHARELRALRRQPTAPLWVRVLGGTDPAAGDPADVAAMFDALEVPPVLRAPLLEVPQRPRVDSLGGAVLVVLHRLGFAPGSGELVSDQVGLLLLPDLLITVEEAPAADSFADLVCWLEARSGSVEQRDLDDILHYLVDELLDGLFPMLERIANRLDDFEELVLQDPKPALLKRTFRCRSQLRTIRNQIWPLRHQIQVLQRQNQKLLGPEAMAGFQEMADLLGLLYDNGELLRHQSDAITQAYAATIGNRMNQVMKTLTILTSVFAPLTFIAGVYGMNFRHMPELAWRHGYPAAMLLMAAVAAIQSYWLWRRGWFQDWMPRR
ncbi:MAG: CorA family divalent cation transporter [Prochlorococcaceae cyanobacterium]